MSPARQWVFYFVFFGFFVAEGIHGRWELRAVGAELTSAATKSSKPAIFEVWGAFQAGKRELRAVGAELTSAATKSSKPAIFEVWAHFRPGNGISSIWFASKQCRFVLSPIRSAFPAGRLTPSSNRRVPASSRRASNRHRFDFPSIRSTLEQHRLVPASNRFASEQYRFVLSSNRFALKQYRFAPTQDRIAWRGAAAGHGPAPQARPVRLEA
jgi:hypothetical protein